MNRLSSLRIIGILIVCFTVFSSISQAQQRPGFTQYMFNGLAINPAYAGSHELLTAVAAYRNQWINFPGAPRTYSASVHSPIKKKKVGLGLNIINDEIGVHRDLGVFASYAYRIRVSQAGVLALGVQGGFNYLESDFTRTNPQSLTDPNFIAASTTNFNFGTGVYFYNDFGYIGASVPYILANRSFRESGEQFDAFFVQESTERRYYFLTAGFVYDLSRDVKLRPSTLVQVQEGAPINFDANVNFILQDRLNLGVSYRAGRSVNFLFQLQATRNFSFGYAYDFAFSEIQEFNRGTHELILTYQLAGPQGIGKLIPCPTHFLR